MGVLGLLLRLSRAIGREKLLGNLRHDSNFLKIFRENRFCQRPLLLIYAAYFFRVVVSQVELFRIPLQWGISFFGAIRLADLFPPQTLEGTPFPKWWARKVYQKLFPCFLHHTLRIILRRSMESAEFGQN